MSLVAKMTETSKLFFKALVGINKELTLHDKIDKYNYLHLKKMNKLYSSSARAIREAAIRNKGDTRAHLRYLKTLEGQTARTFHVALCFLKGKKYSEVEPNVEDKNRFTAAQIKSRLSCRVSREYYKQLDNDIAKFLGE
jgi:hypothetical protein